MNIKTELGENEVRIFYSGKLNPSLDGNIEKIMKAEGYELWASGFNLRDNVRDMAFERKK